MNYKREIYIDPIGTEGRRSVVVHAIAAFGVADLALHVEGAIRQPYVPLTAEKLDELAETLKNAAFALRVIQREGST